MRLATRLALIASLCLLAMAGLLLLREDRHEAALVAMIEDLLEQGARNTWQGFVEDAMGRLNDADLQLRADAALAEALRRGDMQDAATRFTAAAAPLLAVHPDMAAELRRPDGSAIARLRGGLPPGPAADGTLVEAGGTMLLVHALALPDAPGIALFALPAEALLATVGRTLRGTAALRTGTGRMVAAQADRAFATALANAPLAEPGRLAAFAWNGRDWRIARVPVGEATLLVAWDSTEAERESWRNDLIALATVAAGLLLSLFFLQAHTRAALRPLAGAVTVLRALARGELDIPAPAARRQDEVGELIGTVDAFRTALRDQRALGALREEMGAARRIQQAMLPAPTRDGPGFSIDAAIAPAREVGGDFFDHALDADGRVRVTIADVVGKGLAAAIYLAQARAALRAAAHAGGPAACFDQANALLAADNEEALFVTACQAVLDPATGTLRLASAGHPAPLRLAADGTIARIEMRPGRPLGLFAGTRYGETVLQLTPGDRVILFTDGLTDAIDPAELHDRLAAALATGGAAAVVAAGAPQIDDVTCLVLRWTGISPPQ